MKCYISAYICFTTEMQLILSLLVGKTFATNTVYPKMSVIDIFGGIDKKCL